MQKLYFLDGHLREGSPYSSPDRHAPGAPRTPPGEPLRLGRTLIDTATLDRGVARLAAEIERDQAGRPALLVGILKGSIFFLCDLAKKLQTTPVALDFLQVSSYGTGTKSSGNVRLQRDLTTDVAGRDVIIVEDIVDTGRTLQKIVELLSTRHPRSVKICSLLKKKIPGNDGVPVDYLGFTIEDNFVVGYGLDYGELYRNLPFIGILEPDGDAPAPVRDPAGWDSAEPTAPRSTKGLA